jgi:hypothetical protein
VGGRAGRLPPRAMGRATSRATLMRRPLPWTRRHPPVVVSTSALPPFGCPSPPTGRRTPPKSTRRPQLQLYRKVLLAASYAGACLTQATAVAPSPPLPTGYRPRLCKEQGWGQHATSTDLDHSSPAVAFARAPLEHRSALSGSARPRSMSCLSVCARFPRAVFSTGRFPHPERPQSAQRSRRLARPPSHPST